MALDQQGLLEAIEQHPDDIDAYLVLADLLQAEGDPRGELIAMQCELRARGDSPELSVRVARFIDDQAAALLGSELAGEQESKHVTLEWRLGYVEGAAIKARDSDAASAALEVLLASPAARLLRGLSVNTTRKTATLDAEAIFARLEADAPTSLREVRVGDPGMHPLPPSLRTKLPLLSRPPEQQWEEVLAAIAAEKRLKVKINARGLPKLVAKRPPGGAAAPKLAVKAAELLVGLKAEVDKKRHLGLIDAMHQLFTAASVDAFAAALLRRWVRMGEPSAQRWAQDLAALVGGDRTAALLGARLREATHVRAVQAIEILGNIGSPLALTDIYGMVALLDETHSRRQAGADALLHLAAERRLSAEALIDRNVPDPSEHDETTLTRVLDARRYRLEEMLRDGTRLSLHDFNRHLRWSPLLGRYARRLVFGAFRSGKRGKETLANSFRVDDDDQLVGLDDEPVALQSGDTVGVAHPLDLGAETNRRWAERFSALGIAQPFEQLARATYALDDAEKRSKTLKKRFAARPVRFDTINNALYRRGFYPYERHTDDDEYYYLVQFACYFGRGITCAVCISPGFEVEVYRTERMQQIANPLRFSALHPVTASEILRMAESVVDANRWHRQQSRSRPAPNPSADNSGGGGSRSRQRRDAKAGQYPFAQLAKSGRSKCVACGEKIAKDTLRVGVEREVETDHFSGVTTGWLHFECRAKSEDLADIDDVDSLLRANSPGVDIPS